jgi:ankyrin repeat protein
MKNPAGLALEKATRALSVSESINKNQAIINMMQQAGIALSPELAAYVNDHKDYHWDQERFAPLAAHMPELIEHYKRESIARDKIMYMRQLKLSADSPLMVEIGENIESLYEGVGATPVEYNSKINKLKGIIIRERLKHTLPEGTDLTSYNAIITKSLTDELPPSELVAKLTAKLREDGQEVPANLKRYCSSFINLKAYSTPEKIQERMVNNILDIMNNDFKNEILVLNDLRESTLMGKEILYRGLSLTDPKAFIEPFFNNQHRMLDMRNKNDLFLFDVTRPWNRKKEEWNEKAWEINGTYMSYNPAMAIHFVKNHGLLLEVNPHHNKQVISGRCDNEYEVISNQVAPEEIRAIYIIENGVITEIHENPNFSSPHKLPPFQFKVGDVAHSSSFSNDQKSAGIFKESIKSYEVAKLDNRRDSYTSYEDFIGKYSKDEIVKNREIIQKRRGFISYQQKLEACKLDPINCKNYNELYQELKKAVIANDRENMNRLINNTTLLSASDKEGNNLLMLAIIDKSKEMIEFALDKKIDINTQNLRGETALHLAMQSGNIAALDKLINEPGINLSLKDMSGKEAIYDANSEATFNFFITKVPSSIENNIILAKHLHNNQNYDLFTKVINKLDSSSLKSLLEYAIFEKKYDMFEQVVPLLKGNPIALKAELKYLDKDYYTEKTLSSKLNTLVAAHPELGKYFIPGAIKFNNIEFFEKHYTSIADDPELISTAIKNSLQYRNRDVFYEIIPYAAAYPEVIKDVLEYTVKYSYLADTEMFKKLA